MYTTLSSYTPAHAFERALSLIYIPVLRKIYNKPGLKFTLYISSAMMEYFDDHHPEVNILISTLAQKGVIKLLSGISTQSILSLTPPKERANQLEKMTTSIRKRYKLRASSAFFYGQIWSPLYITPLLASGLDKVAISTYKATSREHLYETPFKMNELGRRINVYPSADEVSCLVSQYAQGEINIRSLKDRITDFFENNTREDNLILLNLDQLLQGKARTMEDEDDDISSVFIHLFELAERFRMELCHLEDLEVGSTGYLDSGWYGRDAYAHSLYSFQDMFCRNAIFRYMKNRLNSLFEQVAECKRDKKSLRNMCESHLSHVTNGPLFIYDPQCGPLRREERRVFWKHLIEAERLLYNSSDLLLDSEVDLEDLGRDNYIARNSQYGVVYSVKGGSVVELDYVDKGLNLFDAKSHFDRSFKPIDLKRSFSDKVTSDGVLYKTKYRFFQPEALRRDKSEMLFSLDEENLPFMLEKHFKLRNSTLILETTLTAKKDMEDGRYAVNAYLSPEDLQIARDDHRSLALLGHLDDIRTLKFLDQTDGIQISFTSTELFSVTMDRKTQQQYTVLGLETFTLYEKLTFTFSFSLKEGESRNFKLVFRCTENKSKEN